MPRRRITTQKITKVNDNVDSLETRRKITEHHNCPSGQRWVSGHYRKSKFGFGTVYVEGHCARNGSQDSMKVTEVKNITKFKTPFFEVEKTITEAPVENANNYGGSEE